MKSKSQISLFVAVLAFLATTSFAQEGARKPVKPPVGKIQEAPVTSSEMKGELKQQLVKMPAGGGLSEEWSVPSGELNFMDLPYGYEALEPVIDKMTVEIHYNRHHRAYYNNFKSSCASRFTNTNLWILSNSTMPRVRRRNLPCIV